MNNVLTAADLFAGMGGNSEGARQAGFRVVVAANHWAESVAIHKRNHPETTHFCQDLHQANFHSWPDFDVMMASPSCQGHSLARGVDRPHHDAARSTAWAVVSCAEAKRPRALVVENVPEFESSWQLFPQWRSCLETLGYVLSTQVLDAADLGVPQHRRRVFVVGIHQSVSNDAIRVRHPNLAHTPIGDVIEWGTGSWSPVLKAGRAVATIARWRRGREEFGRRFIMPYYGSGSGLTGRSLARPVGTLTTRDRYALVDGDRMRMFTKRECVRAFAFPSHYELPSSRKLSLHLLGNSVPPPMTRHVLGAVREHLVLSNAA